MDDRYAHTHFVNLSIDINGHVFFPPYAAVNGPDRSEPTTPTLFFVLLFLTCMNQKSYYSSEKFFMALHVF